MTTPSYQSPPGGSGRRALPWIIGGVLVVAALAVTLVLTLGGDDDSDSGGGDTGEPTARHDLSTPEKAAESVAAVAATGDGEALLQLTCLREMACVSSLGEQGSEEQLKEAQRTIIDNVDTLATQLENVEFGARAEASLPNAVEIPYRTPDTDDDSHLALLFIEFEGDWLYAGSAGGGSGEGDGAAPPTT